MDRQSVVDALNRAQKGVEQYLEIMALFPRVDVSIDRDFQRKYNAFYRLRQRRPDFYEAYYRFMQEQKGKAVDFSRTLEYLHSRLNRYEPSFSSKLVATHNPDSPIWDVFVLKNTGVLPPRTYEPNRMAKIVDAYNGIVRWYAAFMHGTDGKQIISIFDAMVPRASEVTNLKKIDFVLWQLRT